MKPALIRLAADLSARGEPYVLATVVWRRAPSSGKEGATALITPDRAVRGWIGGACAEPTVVREALKAIEEGTPRLLFLGPADELDLHRRDGVVAVPIACQSEGALEVYVEPVLPQPQLVAIGRSPAAQALTALASGLGWRTVAVDDGGDASVREDVDRVLTSLDLDAAAIDERSFVVVATQGHYDEDALERALATPAGYVGLVASRKRAESVLGYLRDRGVADEALARVHAPAGLDLGHLAHRGDRGRDPGRDRAAAGRGCARRRARPDDRRDGPARGDRPGVRHDGRRRRRALPHRRTAARPIYFCSARCLEAFEADPARYEGVSS